jgi:translation initiation factor 4G
LSDYIDSEACDVQDDVCVCPPDQWSPLNPEGKKKYERDFLMELQNDPQSKKKPENLPDLEVVLKDNTNRVSYMTVTGGKSVNGSEK